MQTLNFLTFVGKCIGIRADSNTSAENEIEQGGMRFKSIEVLADDKEFPLNIRNGTCYRGNQEWGSPRQIDGGNMSNDTGSDLRAFVLNIIRNDTVNYTTIEWSAGNTSLAINIGYT
ncbi:hypothetical protein EGR_10681 [Echinococcus granulosus]|uniref:Uncharacterized protein n=1 Tax=Echinococcus granulosus TaxID=6210 RepID=W6ULV7_ECHGR|nr:hypothetical protein EGR_10681 [Echinococcus granulosus]EUB54459.1 hypothetical protein EGR_10681 [Echinococcus granulosus]